jgi:hypothetical protein
MLGRGAYKFREIPSLNESEAGTRPAQAEDLSKEDIIIA